MPLLLNAHDGAAFTDSLESVFNMEDVAVGTEYSGRSRPGNTQKDLRYEYIGSIYQIIQTVNNFVRIEQSG
jgi:hypothetical protein